MNNFIHVMFMQQDGNLRRVLVNKDTFEWIRIKTPEAQEFLDYRSKWYAYGWVDITITSKQETHTHEIGITSPNPITLKDMNTKLADIMEEILQEYSEDTARDFANVSEFAFCMLTEPLEGSEDEIMETVNKCIETTLYQLDKPTIH